MTESELRTVLRNNGGYSVSRKTAHGDHYFYAVRRKRGGGREEIYLCPETKLEEKSEEEIVARLSSA